jgi:hypothetical protein
MVLPRSIVVPRWVIAAAVAVAMLLVGAVSSALDITAGPPHPNPGEFVRADAPVYATAPEGWACHYLGTNERLVGRAGNCRC